MGSVSGLIDALDASSLLPGSSSSCEISPRQSFHFTISCSLSFVSPEPNPPSHVHALFTLPTTLFVDPYELEQRSNDRDGPHAIVWGETNLELPLASPQLDTRGSAILLTLDGAFRMHFNVPIHARYLLPAGSSEKERTHAIVEVPHPRIFVSDAQINSLIPHDRASLRLIPRVTPEILQVVVPVGNIRDLDFVEPITTIAIIACFLYVASTLLKWSYTRTTIKSPKKSN